MTAFDRFVPRRALDLLGATDVSVLAPGAVADAYVTIMFVDLRGFSTLSETMEPDSIFGLLNRWFGIVSPLVVAHGGYIDKYIGDAVMAVFPDCPDDALRCAIAIVRRIETVNADRQAARQPPIQAGIGLNTGFIALGVVGDELRTDVTVVGDAVNIASRMEASTKKYGVHILVSEYVQLGLRNRDEFNLRFLDRIRVRGKDVPLSIYEAYSADPEPVREAKSACQHDFDRALANYHYRNIPEARDLLTRCVRTCPEDAPALFYLSRCDEYDRTGVHDCAIEMTTYPVWNDDFRVGHRVIDQHHEKLFQAVAELVKMTDQGDFRNLDSIISFLVKYIDVHFRTEEHLMDKHGYPFAERHKEQHDRFRQSFNGLVAELEPGTGHGVYMAFRVHLLVVDWLVNHTTRMDPHLSRHLCRDDDEN